MFGPGCAYESLLIDRLAFTQACEWQGVILLPGSKPKGLRCRFGVGPRTLSFAWQIFWFPGGPCLHFAQNQIEVFC